MFKAQPFNGQWLFTRLFYIIMGPLLISASQILKFQVKLMNLHGANFNSNHCILKALYTRVCQFIRHTLYYFITFHFIFIKVVVFNICLK